MQSRQPSFWTRFQTSLVAKYIPGWAKDAPNPFADLIPKANSPTQHASGDIFDRLVAEQEEGLVHDPIDYQRGKWATDTGEASVVAKFFERNLGDRKAELDRLADQLGAQKRYTLIEKQKRGGVWWVRVFLYKQ